MFIFTFKPSRASLSSSIVVAVSTVAFIFALDAVFKSPAYRSDKADFIKSLYRLSGPLELNTTTKQLQLLKQS